MNRIEKYLMDVCKAQGMINPRDIEAAVNIIRESFEIATCGNGGSAATAIHFAADLRSIGFNAWDLLSPSKLTQIMNDIGPDEVFSNQVHTSNADLVIAFSASGTSPDIEHLFTNDVRMIIFTSTMNKDRVCKSCPGVLAIAIHSDSYEIIEDLHLSMCHAIKVCLLEGSHLD